MKPKTMAAQHTPWLKLYYLFLQCLSFQICWQHNVDVWLKLYYLFLQCLSFQIGWQHNVDAWLKLYYLFLQCLSFQIYWQHQVDNKKNGIELQTNAC
jgi:hypothetical protein